MCQHRHEMAPGEKVLREDFESFRAAWHRRWREERRADEEGAARALAIARRLASVLYERYGATRVILLGSLARGEFRSGSDIDLAAEGIASSEFFRAGAELERAAEGLRVDLVPIESATPAFVAVLEREGLELDG